MNKLFCLLSLSLLLAGATAQAQSGIRKIDFKNFTYEITDGPRDGKENVTVKDGQFSRMTEDDRLFFTVTDVAYGDLDGDGRDEAIVRTLMNTGGTGQFTNGRIYTMKGGKAVLMTEFEGGDSAYGSLVSASKAATRQ